MHVGCPLHSGQNRVMTSLETIELDSTDQTDIVVPITQPLHFTPYRADIEVTDPTVSIQEVVVIAERPEATVVAHLHTNHGRIEALIRVPRESMTNEAVLTRASAFMTNDRSALIYGRHEQPVIIA